MQMIGYIIEKSRNGFFCKKWILKYSKMKIISFMREFFTKIAKLPSLNP